LSRKVRLKAGWGLFRACIIIIGNFPSKVS
jgi:hypothetical protein